MAKETPILFTGANVRANRAGEKTMTRRVIKPQPTELKPLGPAGQLIPYKRGKEIPDMPGVSVQEPIKCPYGGVGDLLWVRETYARWSNDYDNIIYADDPEYEKLAEQNRLLTRVNAELPYVGFWQKVPAIFMPKRACRNWYEITEVRVERVQDISEEDALAEGIELVERRKHRSDDSYRVYLANTSHLRKPCDGPGYYYRTGGPTTCFQMLWDSINVKPKPAKSNPYTGVWELCKVAYPWDAVTEVTTINTKTSKFYNCKVYIVGNPWVWPISYKEYEHG